MKTTDTTEARYEDVKPSDWGRTALYVAMGALVIAAGAMFLLDISRFIGGCSCSFSLVSCSQRS